ncbi:MAG: hypothetical protein ACO3VQ_12070, partial [Ilumatobacteraceae bacterium]
MLNIVSVLFVAAPLILSLPPLDFSSSGAEVSASGVDGETGDGIVAPQTISSGDEDYAVVFDGTSQYATATDSSLALTKSTANTV